MSLNQVWPHEGNTRELIITIGSGVATLTIELDSIVLVPVNDVERKDIE
jgi:hypothetical protein